MDAVHWAEKRQGLLDGLVDDVTSAVGDVTSAVGGAVSSIAGGDGGIIPTLSVSSDTTTTTSSSSSSSSTSTSISSTSSSSSSSSSSTTTSSSFSSRVPTLPSSTPTPGTSSTPAPPSSSSSTTIINTESDGSVTTMTSVITASPSAEPSPSPSSNSDNAPSGGTAFLENKVLSGVVFGIVGLVGLIGIVFVITFFVRRTQKQRLLNEAIDFTPEGHGYPFSGDGDGEMKRGLTQSSHRNSVSSNSLNAPGVGGYYADAAPMPVYQQQQPYYGATAAAAPFATYAAPSQINSAMRTYDNPAAVDDGAGGLVTVTRKYSNRVPVPPANTQDIYGGYMNK